MATSIFEELKQQQDLTLKVLKKTFSLQAIGLSQTGLNRPELLEWLCEGIHAESIEWCPQEVGTMGSGPWNVTDFDALIDSMGFRLAHLPNPNLKVVVLGSDDWEKASVAEQIYDRDGSNLIVLSQELFIVGILKNLNPLVDIDEAVLIAMAEDHSALSYLIERGFDWTFEAVSNTVTEWEPTVTLAKQSPLHDAGYNVAVGGPSIASRHEILAAFFSGRIPAKLPTKADQQRWGPPRSTQRLYSMATFMSWLCRFQGPKAPVALSKWREDMLWLKQQFYKSAMSFTWPSTKSTSRSISRVRQTTLNPQAAWPFPTASKP